MEGSDLHCLEVRAPGSNFLCRFPREGYERDLTGERKPDSHGVSGLRDHRVRLPRPGAGDDEGAVLLDQHGPPLFRIQDAQCGIAEALFQESSIGSLAVCFACGPAGSVQAPRLYRVDDFPPTFKGCRQTVAGVPPFGLTNPDIRLARFARSGYVCLFIAVLVDRKVCSATYLVTGI